MPQSYIEKLSPEKRTLYVSLEERQRRIKAVVEYVIAFPFVTVKEISDAFDLNRDNVYQILRKKGFRRKWTIK